jgi:CheY-like chemotaxis protein
MSASGLKVMLVEDEFIISMLTEDMLIELGYEVVSIVATLEEGLAMAEQQDFDLAILDINLNGKPSYPIADILQARSVPFVFASGYTGLGIDPKYAAVPQLQKPFSMDALARALTVIKD